MRCAVLLVRRVVLVADHVLVNACGSDHNGAWRWRDSRHRGNLNFAACRPAPPNTTVSLSRLFCLGRVALRLHHSQTRRLACSIFTSTLATGVTVAAVACVAAGDACCCCSRSQFGGSAVVRGDVWVDRQRNASATMFRTLSIGFLHRDATSSSLRGLLCRPLGRKAITDFVGRFEHCFL